MKTDLFLKRFAKSFPKKYAKMNHDRVGLMTGKKPEEFHKVLLALDLDWEILPLVKKEMPDIIITHHPFIYGTRSFVFKHDESKRLLCEEIDKLGIPVYSFHTNFDTGKGGMNDALASALELEDIQVVEGCKMMRGGKLKKEMEVEKFARYAKEKLNLDFALLLPYGRKSVRSVAVVGGAGSGLFIYAKDAGYDIYLSGDIPHHVRRYIVNNKYNYLDIPHEVERIFMPTMKKILLEMDPSLEIVIVDHEKMAKVI